MKNRFCFLLIFFFVSLTAFAQIQDRILGFHLGVSSKQTVITKLKHRGYKINYEQDNRIGINNVTFAGYLWHYVRIEFQDNKLCSIDFVNRSSISKLQVLNQQFEILSMQLHLKYFEKYYDPDKSSSDANTDWSWYSDGKNLVVISKNLQCGEWWIDLSYYNSFLVKRQMESNFDDL